MLHVVFGMWCWFLACLIAPVAFGKDQTTLGRLGGIVIGATLIIAGLQIVFP